MVSVTLVTRPSSQLSAVLRRNAARLRLALNVISLNRLREVRLAPNYLILDLTTVTVRAALPERVWAGTTVFVLPPGGTVATVWLPWLRRPQTEVIFVGSEPGGPFAPVLRLLANSADVRRRAVVNAVMQASAVLQGFEHETAAVLATPWRIRRPRDLAAACGSPLPVLRARVKDAGLRRVEHLITLIRWLASQHLTTYDGMAPGHARVALGIDDASNFRRQCARALG